MISFPLYAPFWAPDFFRTVRFKVIADDGTVILIPCETLPVALPV